MYESYILWILLAWCWLGTIVSISEIGKDKKKDTGAGTTIMFILFVLVLTVLVLL